MKQAPKDMNHFWIKCGQDLRSRRLRDTWEWLRVNEFMSMPERVDTTELSSGMTLSDRCQKIATFRESYQTPSAIHNGSSHRPIRSVPDTAMNGYLPSADFYLSQGTLSDGGSIPRFAWTFIGVTPKGKYFRPFLMHDELTNAVTHYKASMEFYADGKLLRKDCPATKTWRWKSELMYYALRYCGMGHTRAYLMHLAVCWHGKCSNKL